MPILLIFGRVQQILKLSMVVQVETPSQVEIQG